MRQARGFGRPALQSFGRDLDSKRRNSLLDCNALSTAASSEGGAWAKRGPFFASRLHAVVRAVPQHDGQRGFGGFAIRIQGIGDLPGARQVERRPLGFERQLASFLHAVFDCSQHLLGTLHFLARHLAGARRAFRVQEQRRRAEGDSSFLADAAMPAPASLFLGPRHRVALLPVEHGLRNAPCTMDGAAPSMLIGNP
jgi:hypothetical protein